MLAGLVAWRYTQSAAVGWVTILLAGLYAPFVIIGERALTEIPFALALLAMFLALHETIERRAPLFGLLTGVGLFSVIAARTQYLSPLLGMTSGQWG